MPATGLQNPEDGRKFIERLPDGTFRQTFTKTFSKRPNCTGTWRLLEDGSVYAHTYNSTDCFSNASKAPTIGSETTMKLRVFDEHRTEFSGPGAGPSGVLLEAKIQGSFDSPQ